MAAKKTNWGAVLLVIGLVAVGWYFLTRKKTAKAGGGGGGVFGGGGGPLSSALRPPQSGGGGGIGAGPGGGFGGGGGGVNPLAQLLRNFLGQQNAYNQQVARFLQPQNPDLSGVSIPSIPFDWGGYSPNDFLTTSDVPYYQDQSLTPDYIDSGSIPYQQFDWGSSSPSDFLVTQSVPADAGSSLDVIDTSSYLDNTQIDANGNTYDATGMTIGADTSGGGGGLIYAY